MTLSNATREPTFIMLVGLPGSGKSTYAKTFFTEINIHSSDKIREELSGDVNNQNINNQVFELLHKRIKDDLINGRDTIYDATNISSKRRKGFLQELSKIPCKKSCFLIATPYEICLERNNARERVVPEEVIKRMYKNFDIPWYNEGWDTINIVSEFEGFYGNWQSFIAETLDYDQRNSHHNLTLGKHCLSTYNNVLSKRSKLNHNNTIECLVSAALHDCGKPFCQTFKDSKGNDSESAHYYDHERVGAYKSLFYSKPENTDHLFVAALIRYHMILYFYKNWKKETIDKYEKELKSHPYLKDIDFYNTLKILHTADISAH